LFTVPEQLQPHQTFTPQFLLLSTMSYDSEYPFGQLGSVGHIWDSCSPSQLIAHPQPAHWQGNVKSRKGLDTMQALFSNEWPQVALMASNSV